MRTNDSIQNILMNNKQLMNNTDKYTQSGVYKLSCPNCNKAYVGQTGRNFLIRFNEHKAAFRTTKTLTTPSPYQAHTLFRPHPRLYADTTTPEQRITPQYHTTLLHIQRIYKNNHLNDEHTISPNKIFQALLTPDQP